MDSKDLKKDVYVRWVADRDWSPDIDTYGKVLDVNDTELKIITYDDFKTVSLQTNGSSVRDEMRLATKDDVIDYLEEIIDLREDRKAELTRKYKKDIKSLDRDLVKIKENLAKLTE